MSLDAWLETHPYLRDLARFSSRVAAASEGLVSSPRVPSWDDYAGDFAAGVPLLQSAAALIDLEPAGTIAGELLERLAGDDLAGAPASDIRALADALRREPSPGRRVAAYLLGDDAWDPPRPGLLRYLGWVATARYLEPVVKAFAAWRDEERWMRPYCPTCGSAPAMAQLVGADPGRRRLLACGRCRTRWQYRRTQCPFCENDSQRLSALAVEGQAGLRIDYCEACRGYLKTYDGEGDEAVLLADWTSLHLDVAARDRGLERRAASLYDLPAAASA